MNLRELTLADAPWCAELEQLLFPGDSPWSVEEFQSEITHVLTKYFGVEISGRLVGYSLKFALTMSRRWRCTTATDLRR